MHQQFHALKPALVHLSHLAQTAKCTIWVISHAQLPVTCGYRDIGLIFSGAGEQSFLFIC